MFGSDEWRKLGLDMGEMMDLFVSPEDREDMVTTDRPGTTVVSKARPAQLGGYGSFQITGTKAIMGRTRLG
jgi:hypothetical protein